MSIEVEDIEGMQTKPDFRRANGAPMVKDKDGKNQRLSRPSGWGKNEKPMRPPASRPTISMMPATAAAKVVRRLLVDHTTPRLKTPSRNLLKRTSMLRRQRDG